MKSHQVKSFLAGFSHLETLCIDDAVTLTVLKTSSASCKMAIFVHLNCFISEIRVGLCTVALGWVRNRVGNRFRLDKAGEEAP